MIDNPSLHQRARVYRQAVRHFVTEADRARRPRTSAVVVSGDEVSVWRRLLVLQRRVLPVLTKGLDAEQMEWVAPGRREIVDQIQLLDEKLGEETPLDLLILWAAGIVGRRHAGLYEEIGQEREDRGGKSPVLLIGGVGGTQALGIIDQFCGIVACNDLERARASIQIRAWVQQAKQESKE